MKLPAFFPLAFLGMYLAGLPAAAQTLTQTLPAFHKLSAGPLITLVLEHGTREQVRFDYRGITPDKIHCEVEGNTLRIYLDDAKFTVKDRKHWRDGQEYRRPVYGPGVSVTAYVTYQQLRTLEKRGEESISCHSPLQGDKLTLRLFGENEARLARVEARRFKASLFGENTLQVDAGEAVRQRYRSFGENTIDTRHLAGAIASTSLFGDSRLRLNASEEVRITAFGESDVQFSGGGHVSKRLVLGEASIGQLR